jgi:hypothetical protein
MARMETEEMIEILEGLIRAPETNPTAKCTAIRTLMRIEDDAGGRAPKMLMSGTTSSSASFTMTTERMIAIIEDVKTNPTARCTAIRTLREIQAELPRSDGQFADLDELRSRRAA